jgi:hypothetical protein
MTLRHQLEPFADSGHNHASVSFAGIVGVYQRHSFAQEKRAALDAWGHHIGQLVGSKPAPVLPRYGRRR